MEGSSDWLYRASGQTRHVLEDGFLWTGTGVNELDSMLVPVDLRNLFLHLLVQTLLLK